MPIQDAINFINTVGFDKELRDSITMLERDKIQPELEARGYRFSGDEFEESINLMHVQCKTEEQANFLFEVVWWFKLLF